MMLPARSKVRAVQHHPSLPYEFMAAFMGELSQVHGISARALEFLILTATRTSETLGAQWSEIDLDSKVWTIPASRMKAGRVHQVPLSLEAVKILEKLPKIERVGLLFPGQRYGRPLSSMALLQVMRRLGYGVGGERGAYVPHGFRSSFRDWAGEVSTFPRDVCEMALAHVIENKVESAYRRGSMLEKRRAMMEEWARFIVPAEGHLEKPQNCEIDAL
ncbi:MAG: tyrosine-type recombinase/integrase [Methylococcaceae bacterium]